MPFRVTAVRTPSLSVRSVVPSPVTATPVSDPEGRPRAGTSRQVRPASWVTRIPATPAASPVPSVRTTTAVSPLPATGPGIAVASRPSLDRSHSPSRHTAVPAARPVFPGSVSVETTSTPPGVM